jgi:hypothetical protein
MQCFCFADDDADAFMICAQRLPTMVFYPQDIFLFGVNAGIIFLLFGFHPSKYPLGHQAANLNKSKP